MIKRLLACILLLLITLAIPCFAQSEKEHRIDQALEDCIEKDSSTAGMAQCTYKAEEMWDSELNKIYQQLSASLDEKEKEALKKAQKNWIQYRDSEFDLIGTLYSKMEGSMYIPMRAADRMEIVKARALELQNYLNLLQER